MRALAVIAAAAALSACRVAGPAYQRPAVEVPPAFRDAAGAHSPESIADLPWWQVFRNPTLESLRRGRRRGSRDHSCGEQGREEGSDSQHA